MKKNKDLVIEPGGAEVITEKSPKSASSIVLKLSKIILDAALLTFVAFAVFTLVIAVSSKKDADGTATVFGTQLRFVQSDSMGECDQTDVSQYAIKSIPVKSCVFIQTVPENEEDRQKWYADIQIGDVLTFKYKYDKQVTITHRVVKKEEKSTGGYIVTLQGDNIASKDNVGQQVIDTSLQDTSFNYIIGKVTGANYFLGLVIYSLKTPVGIALIVIVPCSLIVLYNIYRIIRTIWIDKKDKMIDVTNSKDQEIELLRQQIAELQSSDLNKSNESKEES